MPKREVFECDVCHKTTSQLDVLWREWERRGIGPVLITAHSQPTSPIVLCSDECEQKAILPSTDNLVKSLRELQAIVASDPNLSDRKRKILAEATAVMNGRLS